MFDISLGEISLIGLIALLVLGPKEMLSLYKSVKALIAGIKESISDYFKEVRAAVEDEDIVEIIFDDEGRPQKAYKLEKIMPYIKDKKEDEQA